MAWQCEFVSLTTQGANVIPTVRFFSGDESFTEDFRGNDITLESVKQRCALRLDQLEARDLAKSTFDGLATGVFDPRL